VLIALLPLPRVTDRNAILPVIVVLINDKSDYVSHPLCLARSFADMGLRLC
jgi:hypothetical protein